jgi:ATP-dependent protease ClpP protease subunit
MKNRLLNLFQANKDRGSFKAQSGADGNVIELYDVIVSSEAEASWYGGVSLQAFAKALGGMTGDVHLRINSPGGDVFAGIAMAQLMREYKGDIIAHVDGYAASAASLIAVAAKKCIMAPASMMMIHKAWTFAIGNADDLLETADLLDKIDGQLAETYAGKAKAKSGKKAAEFTAMMAKVTWFTPQEAIDCGLADEIAGDAEKPAEAAARALWDMSAFENAPKPQAPKTESESEKAAAALAAAAAVTAAENAAAESERLKCVRALQDRLVTAA